MTAPRLGVIYLRKNGGRISRFYRASNFNVTISKRVHYFVDVKFFFGSLKKICLRSRRRCGHVNRIHACTHLQNDIYRESTILIRSPSTLPRDYEVVSGVPFVGIYFVKVIRADCFLLPFWIFLESKTMHTCTWKLIENYGVWSDVMRR